MPPSNVASPIPLLRWIFRQLGRRYLTHLLLTLVFAGVLLLPAQLFQYFATSLHGNLSSPSLVPHLVLFGSAIALATGLLTYLNSLSRESVQLRIETALRFAATEKLLSVPLEKFDGLPRGEFLTRLERDLSKVEGFVAVSLPLHLRYLMTLFLASGLFFYQCGALALVPILIVLAVAALNFLGQKKLLPLLDELRTLHAGIFQQILQSFESVRTLRTHGASSSYLRWFERQLRQVAARSLHVVSLAGIFDGGNAFSYEVMMGACLAFAAWRVSSGQMSYNTALTFPFYLGFLYSSAESLAGAIGEWAHFTIDARRLTELLPSLTEDAPESTSQPLSDQERVKARHLSIGYNNTPLTPPLHVDLEPGRTLLVVGPSGCGKSTLLEVLAGLRTPLSGTISSGIDEACALVEQRACLWSGTVRGNLTEGLRAPLEDEALWSVLGQVGLASLVEEAGGLDARVDDRGANFSEGQRYRLALARALLLPRPFLLLDEPFAALDPVSVATVVRAINADRKQRGYVIVTHQIPAGLRVDATLDLGGAAPQECLASR